MINAVIFEDEITVYWDKQWDFPDGIFYRVSCGNIRAAKTQYTHFTFRELRADTEYFVQVERLGENGESVEVLYAEKLRTNKKRKRIDVTKAPYFAKCDGKTLNTQALQRAIDDCKAGETVYIPKGIYLTGALNLHSDMELYVEEGAMLKGSVKPEDYLPKCKSRFEGSEVESYKAMLNIGTLDHTTGYTTKNLIIRGGGIIWGGGFALCWNIIDKERGNCQELIDASDDWNKQNVIPGRRRGRLLAIYNCENVILSNVTLGYGASWNVHMVYSRNILTYDCKIQSEGVWNGDGWNPDSSENCTVFNTEFKTHDDAVAIKSGKNLEGKLIGRPTKNVRVFHCHGKNGVAMGSELSGGIENVFVWDCCFVEGVAGCNTNTTRKRGGYVKNVQIRNCDFVDIRMMTGYECNNDGEEAGALTVLENFSYENVRMTGCAYAPSNREKLRRPPILLCGFDEKNFQIKDVCFKNVIIYPRDDNEKQKIEVKNVQNLTIENLNFIKRIKL